MTARILIVFCYCVFAASASADPIRVRYEPFDGSLPPERWNTSGTVGSNNNGLGVFGRVAGNGTTSEVNTEGKLIGGAILGYSVGDINTNPSGGLENDFTGFVELTNGTDYIRWHAEHTVNQQNWRLSSGGVYGNNSSLALVSGESIDAEVIPIGGDLVIFAHDVEVYRFANTTAATNSYFRLFVSGDNGPAGEDYPPEAPFPSHGLGIASFVDVWTVPEPSTMLLLSIGFVVLYEKHRRTAR